MLPDFLRLMSTKYDTMYWGYLISGMENLKEGETPRDISRDVVVRQMIVCLGVSESLEILRERPQFSSQISCSTWVHFVEGGRIEKEQEAVIHEILEATDS